MLHLMFMDGGQLRNFISTSIVVFSIPFLLEKKYGVFKYIVGVLVAMSVHFMAIFYLVFAVIRIPSGIVKKLIKLIPVFAAFIFLDIRYGDFTFGLLFYASQFMNQGISNKIETYISSRTRFGFLVPLVIFSCFYLAIFFFNRKMKQEECHVRMRGVTFASGFKITISDYVSNNYDFYKLVEKINTISLCFLPLCIFNLTFYRLFRNVCLLNWMFFAAKYETIGPAKKRAYLSMVSIALLLGWQIWDFTIYLPWGFETQIFFGF